MTKSDQTKYIPLVSTAIKGSKAMKEKHVRQCKALSGFATALRSRLIDKVLRFEGCASARLYKGKGIRWALLQLEPGPLQSPHSTSKMPALRVRRHGLQRGDVT